MAFSGYLLRKPSTNTYFPEKFIEWGSYQVTPDIRQDKDPKRNLNGVLKRAVVSARPSTIKFATRELHQADLNEIKAFWSACLVNAKERKYRVSFWNPDTGNYKTENMYMPDVVYSIIYHTDDDIVYAPVEYELIGYGD